MPNVEKQREFAVEIVARLREAGFEAYWAGGCVRDELLGRTPNDYDVATNATPPQIRRLFGHRRTLPIGAAFGVITVLGPKEAGMVEVATFREEAGYSDGRHPDRVTFSSAEEDAQRRDFTINGLFYDPIDRRVLDFVGGQEDLARRRIRAIGDPYERFTEDKLRMLRAVRFAATFDFELDAATLDAIRPMARQIEVVSAERIGGEVRRMLVGTGRDRAVRLLLDAGLADVVLPEVARAEPEAVAQRDANLAVLGRLAEPSFPLAAAGLLDRLVAPEDVDELGRRLRLANKEIERIGWLLTHVDRIGDARSLPFSALQPLLIHEGIDELLALREACCPGAEEVDYCRELLAQPREQLDPPPLLTGDDLKRHGIPPGPLYGRLLAAVRDAQLDGAIHGRDEAFALVDRLR